MSDDTNPPVYEYRNTPEGEARVKAQLGIEPPQEEPEVSINAQDYPLPHKYMHFLRGIPMGKHQDVEIPPINIPPECQHALAVHLELCGFEHNPDKQVIVHLKPELGDDTPMNPGTWVRKSEVPNGDETLISTGSIPMPEPDLTALAPEHLDALEAAVKKAKIAKEMVAQADPEARKAAEKLLTPETPSKMPTEEELKAAMDLASQTERDGLVDTDLDESGTEGELS